MQTLYCASCAGASKFEGIKPKFCGLCGQPFDKAFVAEKFPQSSPSPSPVAKASTNRFARPSRPAHTRPEPQEIEGGEEEFGEESYTEKDEIYARAQELAQGISASDFMVGTDDSDGRTFKFEDFVREAQSKQPAQPVAKAPRARKQK